MRISICIPTWEQYGYGAEFLNDNLREISKQKFKNFNVIVSDHSKDDRIQILCEQYNSLINVKYLRNRADYGNGPANTNNAIKNADGEIIKIIFQDDFLFQDNALSLVSNQFQEDDCNWLVNGCNHTHDHGRSFSNFMVPYWNERIPIGVNTISSPSVLSFRNNIDCFFDENLTMLMDCEMYYQLYTKYGPPKVIADCLTTNRMHEHQISKLCRADIQLEIDYVRNKHKL